MLEQGFAIAKTNWKHNLLPHVLLAVMLCLVAPFIMGVKNLEEPQVAKVIEMYFSFLGVILLIPLFLPDTNKDIQDLTASKKISITAVRMIRLLQSVVVLSVLLLLVLWGLKQGDCSFHYGKCFYAAMANSIAVGGLGLLFYSITDQIVIAYLMPFIYYIISLGSGWKYLGHFWLLSFSAGRITDKKYILIMGILMTMLSLFIKWKRRA